MDSFINPTLLSSAHLLSQSGVPTGFQSHFSDLNDHKLVSQPGLLNMNTIPQSLDMNLYARAMQAPPATLPFGMESGFGFQDFAHPTHMEASFCSQNELLLKNDVARFEPLVFDLQDEPVPDIENDDDMDPFNTPFNHFTSSLMQKSSVPIAIPQHNVLTPTTQTTSVAVTPIDRDDEELEDSPELPTSPPENTPSNALVPVSAVLSSATSEYLLHFQQKKQPQSSQTVGHINLESDVYVAYQNIQFSLETPLHLFGGVQLQVVLMDWENNVVQGGFCQGDVFPVSGNPTIRKVKLNKMRPLRSACPFTSRRHNRLGPFHLKIYIPELGISQPLWNSSPFFVISHPKYESEVKKEH